MMLGILATDSLPLPGCRRRRRAGQAPRRSAGRRPGRLGQAELSAKPAPKLSPAKVADNGQIRLTEGIIQTDTVPSCPGIKIPSVIIFYTSSPGFTGTDTFTLVPGTNKPRNYKVIVAPEA